MNSTQSKGVVIDRDKGKIIKRYKDGIKIHILAGEYNIKVDTLRRRFKKWGVKIRKGEYKRRIQKKEHPKRKFSLELQVKMRENTRINNKHGKHCEFVNKTLDQKLVSNILNRPYL